MGIIFPFKSVLAGISAVGVVVGVSVPFVSRTSSPEVEIKGNSFEVSFVAEKHSVVKSPEVSPEVSPENSLKVTSEALPESRTVRFRGRLHENRGVQREPVVKWTKEEFDRKLEEFGDSSQDFLEKAKQFHGWGKRFPDDLSSQLKSKDLSKISNAYEKIRSYFDGEQSKSEFARRGFDNDLQKKFSKFRKDFEEIKQKAPEYY